MINYMKFGVWSLYSVVIGCIVGFSTWLFLTVLHAGVNLLWFQLPSENNVLWPIGMGLIGGMLVGLYQKYIGPYPQLTPEIIAEHKTDNGIDYRNVPKNVLGALIVLCFGASLGQEAALVGLIAGLSSWAGGKMKRFYKGKEEIQQQIKNIDHHEFETTTDMILHSPLMGLGWLLKDYSITKIMRVLKIGAYSLATASGVLVCMFLSKIDHRPSAIIRLDQPNMGSKELLSIIPLMLIGILVVKLYGMIRTGCHQVFKPLEKNMTIRSVVGGLIFGIMGVLLPYTLFTGELGARGIIANWMDLSAAMLIVMGIAKLFLVEVCLATGWKGGELYPIFFSGIAIGYGIATIIPIDPILSAAVVATTLLSGITRKPVGVLLLLALFLPVKLIPIMVFVALGTDYVLRMRSKEVVKVTAESH